MNYHPNSAKPLKIIFQRQPHTHAQRQTGKQRLDGHWDKKHVQTLGSLMIKPSEKSTIIITATAGSAKRTPKSTINCHCAMMKAAVARLSDKGAPIGNIVYER